MSGENKAGKANFYIKLGSIAGGLTAIVNVIKLCIEISAGTPPALWGWIFLAIGNVILIASMTFWFEKKTEVTLIKVESKNFTPRRIPKHSKTIRTCALVCMILIPAGEIILLAAVHLHFRHLQFAKSDFGILVLKIDGDKDGAIAQKYFHSVENELVRSQPYGPLKIHLVNDSISSFLELNAAHALARKIGKKYNAELVLWGTAAGARSFYPNITIVNYTPNDLWINNELDLNVQDAGELELPKTMLSETDVFAYYLVGFIDYQRHKLNDALLYFGLGLQKSDQFSALRGDFLSYAAFSYLGLAEDGEDTIKNLKLAAACAESSIQAYNSNIDIGYEYVARSEMLLGNAYTKLFELSQDRKIRTQSIEAYKGALKMYNSTNFPLQWAAINVHLGMDYGNYFRGAITNIADINSALSCLNNAVTVFTETKYPDKWAALQFYRSEVFEQAPGGVGQSIEAIQLALRVVTRKKNPTQWLMMQVRLCVDFPCLGTGDKLTNINRSITAGEAALGLLNDKQQIGIDTSRIRAIVDEALCPDYAQLQGFKNLQSAIAAGQDGLLYITPSNDVSSWLNLQMNLANCYFLLSSNKSTSLLALAISHYESIMNCDSATNNSALVLETENNLARANIILDLIEHNVSIHEIPFNRTKQ